MTKSFCSMPFNSLEVSPDGTCQVCCKINKPLHSLDGTPFNVMKTSLKEIWNSDHINKIRKEFLDGEKPQECKLCWTEEEAGIKSLRLQSQYNQKYDIVNPELNYLSLKLSNKCNLACRICSPHLSSLWQSQFTKLNFPLEPKAMFETISLQKFENEKLDILHEISSHIDHLLIYGGEPLINDEVLDFLDFLSRSGLAKNIHLTLNTNASVYTDSLISLLSSFQRIDLFLSIDDIGERFEYQRWPARWEKIDTNIKRFSQLRDPFFIGIFPTVSILNVLNLKEILNHLNSYGLPITFNNLIHQPEILSVKNISSDLKEVVCNSIDDIDFTKVTLVNPNEGHAEFIKNFIKLPHDPGFVFHHKDAYRDRVMHFMKPHDGLRNQELKNFLPELWNLLN